MANKLHFLLLLLASTGLSAYAQSTFKFYDDISLPQTDAWNFVRQGEVSPSLYTGTINLSVPIYEYKDKDYTIKFDLQFEAVEQSWQATSFSDTEYYNGFLIGNTLSREKSEATNSQVNFEIDEIDNNSYKVLGGVTDVNHYIIMNYDYSDWDYIEYLIHELFHTLGFSHPKGKGGKQGVMAYPPVLPTDEDAQEIADSDFLPTITE